MPGWESRGCPIHTGSFIAGMGGLEAPREQYERNYILKELGRTHGNISRAAEALGLERSHLYRKMKALGIHLGE